MKFITIIKSTILISLTLLISLSIQSNSNVDSNSSLQNKAESSTEFLRNQIKSRVEKLYKRNNAFKFSTHLKDSKRGSILTLADHKVKCPKKHAMTGFHLWGKKRMISNKISFEYNCTPINIPQVHKYKAVTPEVKVGSKRNALDKMAHMYVHCKQGFLLKTFKLMVSKNKKNIHFKYSCIQAQLDKCETKHTNLKNGRFGGMFYKSISSMSNHLIQADHGFALQGFKGETSKGKFRMTFTQCKFGKKEEKKPAAPHNNKKSKIINFAKKARKIKKHIKKISKEKVPHKDSNAQRRTAHPHSKKEDKKINKKGKKFCKKFCQPGNVEKKCNAGSTDTCRLCVLKGNPDSTEHIRMNQLCNDVCRKPSYSKKCKFFPFKMTVERKAFDEMTLLKKAIK